MEEMKNENETQGVLSNKLLSMFDDYEQKQTKSNNRPSREDLLAKYFTPRNRTEVFRILPPLKGREYTEEAWFHVVKSNTSNGKRYKKVYCPAHNNPRVAKKEKNGNPILDKAGKPVLIVEYCPLCAKNKAILAKQDPSLRGIKKDAMTKEQLEIFAKNKEIYKDAVQWEAKIFYIIRGIDKGQQKDGVKFWRFKHNFNNQGVHDKLMPVLSSYVNRRRLDYTDPKMGTDLVITVVDATMHGSDRTYKEVSSITSDGPSPLHNDPVVIKQWVGDPLIWRDVFKPAKAPQLEPVDYLERISRGVDPYWDDTDPQKKQWVFPDPVDAGLQELANTRTMNLDADRDEKIELASDLVAKSYDDVSINNITPQDVGTFKDDAMDALPEVAQPVEKPVEKPVVNEVEKSEDNIVDSNEYDDLPF